MTAIPWFSFDPDERRDAERVVGLEELAAATPDVTEAAGLLAEADALRDKWNHPRQRFSSIAEIVEELQAIARDAREVDVTDPRALDDLGTRASRAGLGLEDFAEDLEEHGADDR